MGKFGLNIKKSTCQMKQTDMQQPWQNAAEGKIHELKAGAGRKMVKSILPQKLFDNCLELESYTRSNTAHGIYMLHGEVPETFMSGETYDIIQFCELEQYEWVKLLDTAVQFPGNNMVLGRYIGPIIDVGPEFTVKILNGNGEVVHRSTHLELNLEEIVSPTKQAARKEFDELTKVKLGPEATYDDFEELDIEKSYL